MAEQWEHVPPGSNVRLVHRYRAGDHAGPAPLVVLLHGYGSNEDDLFSLAPLIDPAFHVASPRAPRVLAPTSFAWFALGLTGADIEIDLPQALDSVSLVSSFVRDMAERPSVDARHVYLIGFSQGAMVAAAVALTHPEHVAGAVIMSGAVVPSLLGPPPPGKEVRDLPILMLHGFRDPVVPVELARAGRDALTALSVDLRYSEFDMGHEVTAESFAQVRQWLDQRG
jgi:phospholipase/carboxylesterase